MLYFQLDGTSCNWKSGIEIFYHAHILNMRSSYKLEGNYFVYPEIFIQVRISWKWYNKTTDCAIIKITLNSESYFWIVTFFIFWLESLTISSRESTLFLIAEGLLLISWKIFGWCFACFKSGYTKRTNCGLSHLQQLYRKGLNL